ncbi:MAG TPA: amino acid permease, partial [Thermoprotei archaeon]|nr:amino acid permease [Thermoprotei archaeon]
MAGRFKRELGLFQLTMFGIGAILGAGWLFAPAKAAAIAGPSEVYAWLIAGLMLMLVALVYAELGSSFPTAGGVAKYSDYSHGPLLGFITGWSIFLAGVSYSALEAVASAQALSFLYSPLASSSGSSLSPLGVAVAFVFLVLFFSLNLAGVRKVGGFLSILTLLKFLVPI